MRKLYLLLSFVLAVLVDVFSQSVPCSVNITTVSGPTGDCSGMTATLTAEGAGAFQYLINNNFDGGNAGPGWSSNITADFSNPCDPSYDGGTYMWMGNSSPHPVLLKLFHWI